MVTDRLPDRVLVALTDWGEARGESLDGQAAVGCVIRNRVRLSPRYGVGWRGVCLKPWAFSCWRTEGGAANAALVRRLAGAVLRDDHAAAWPTPAIWRQWAISLAIADGVMDGGLKDWTHGATHYVTRALLDAHPPAWTAQAKRTAEIGHHVFFAEVG